jgi:2'-5' RNA ligase
MELYINRTWTKLYGNAYIAEAIAWSETGNHATIFATGDTADEANAKLISALRELRLIPEAFSTEDELSKVQRKEDPADPSGAS